MIVQEDNDADVAVAAGLIGFTAGIAIGAAMDNNYYYGPMAGTVAATCTTTPGMTTTTIAKTPGKTGSITGRISPRNEPSAVRIRRSSAAIARRPGRRAHGPFGEPAGDVGAEGSGAAAGPGASGTRRFGADRDRHNAPRNRTGSAEARGYGEGSRTTQSATPRTSSSGTRSDAFSGYSSGSSQRASSSRGQSSRGASRGGGRRRSSSMTRIREVIGMNTYLRRRIAAVALLSACLITGVVLAQTRPRRTFAHA